MPENLHVTFSRDMLFIHVILWDNVFWKKADVYKELQKWSFLLFLTQDTHNIT